MTVAALADWTVTDQQTSLRNGPAVSSDLFDVAMKFTASEVAEWPQQLQAIWEGFIPAVIMTQF